MTDPDVSAFMDAIQRFHGSESTYVDSVHILEQAEDGQTPWDGRVWMFDLIDCLKAARCYAWNDWNRGRSNQGFAFKLERSLRR